MKAKFFRPSLGRKAAIGFLFSSSCLLALPAMAQETAPSPADSQAGVIFRWINFAIVFGGILWAAMKSGPYFRGRTEEIAAKVAEGTRAREAAERQRQEVRAKLAGIDQEVAHIREDAKRSTAAEAERLRAMAKREAEMIERAAQAEIEAAQRSAQLELKALAARLAVDLAEALLIQELTPEAESALIHQFVAELSGSVN